MNTLTSRILNITPHERQRVFISWLVSFFYRVGFVVGWTSITAMFISKYGIAYFPILFILNSIFIILGTAFYSRIIAKIEQNRLIMFTVLAATLMLLSATLFGNTNSPVFFGLLIIGESVFVAQLYIILTYFIEDQFTPLESERTFPIIESAETIGGIVGGAAVSYFVTLMAPEKLIYLWIIFLAAIVPIILYYQMSIPKLPSFELHEKPNGKRLDGPIKRFGNSLKNISKIPFLKGLLLIVLTQWIFVNMMEFQYTKSIEQNITHREEQSLAKHEKKYGDILQIALLNDPRGQSIPERGLKFPAVSPLKESEERSLVKKLGSFQIIFSAVALLVQLFIASRLIHSLGIVGSLMLHPIIMLMSLVGLFLKFGFYSAFITKANFEAGSVLFRNAYNTSYYAMRHDVCESAREFLEGFIKPVGAIAGMTLLIFFHLFLESKYLTMAINVTMVLVLSVMLFATILLQKKYTVLSKDILFSPDEDELEKWKAVEILGQKGHVKALDILFRGLSEYENHEPLKMKILQTLGQIKNAKAIPLLVSAFQDSRRAVRLAAVKAIASFGSLGKEFFSQAFSRYHLLSALKGLFRSESEQDIRLAVIRVFSMLQEPDTVAFLLSVLEDGTPDMKAQCITVCGLFKDPSIVTYLEPYLQHENPHIRASALCALWQFAWLRPKLTKYFREMLGGTKEEQLSVLMCNCGIQFEGLNEYLHKIAMSEDTDLRFHAGLILAKKGDISGMRVLSEILPQVGHEHLEYLTRHFFASPPKYQHRLKNILSKIFSEYIHDLIRQSNGKPLHEFETSLLEKLVHIYTLLGHQNEIFHLQRILSGRQTT